MYQKIVTTGRQSLESPDIPPAEAVRILWEFFKELKQKPLKKAWLCHCILITLFQQKGMRRSNRYIFENSFTSIHPLVCHWLIDMGAVLILVDKICPGLFSLLEVNCLHSLLPYNWLLTYQGEVASSEPVLSLRLCSLFWGLLIGLSQNHLFLKN